MYSSTTEYQRTSLTILPTENYNLPFMGHKIPYLSSLLVTCHQSSWLYGVRLIRTLMGQKMNIYCFSTMGVPHIFSCNFCLERGFNCARKGIGTWGHLISKLTGIVSLDFTHVQSVNRNLQYCFVKSTSLRSMTTKERLIVEYKLNKITICHILSSSLQYPYIYTIDLLHHNKSERVKNKDMTSRYHDKQSLIM